MVGHVRSIPTGRTTGFAVASALMVGFLAGIRTASAVHFSGGFSATIHRRRGRPERA
jgi:hypothetical protein